MRRELERRRLSAEEHRVANAAAEYRKRLAENGGERGRDPTRAVSIQNKVQSLLKENDRPAAKTAAGYGRFTNSDASLQMKQFEAPQNMSTNQTPRMPATQHVGVQSSAHVGKHLWEPPPAVMSPPSHPSHAPSVAASTRTVKPAAPPKPKNMRTGMGDAVLEPVEPGPVDSKLASSPTDDWEASFSKRYPSLSGLEMVETEID